MVGNKGFSSEGKRTCNDSSQGVARFRPAVHWLYIALCIIIALRCVISATAMLKEGYGVDTRDPFERNI